MQSTQKVRTGRKFFKERSDIFHERSQVPEKTLLYYYLVAMMIVVLFNFIAMPWISEHQIRDVDYNTFVTMTEQGEVGKVEIQQQDNRILFTSADGKTVYKTAMVPDDDLVQRLLDAGVSTTGEEFMRILNAQ